jgi:pyruvate,water dikinase
MSKYIKWFRELSVNDVAEVGGKNANLGEMYSNLTSAGVKVPNGYAVTASAYKYVLDYNNLWDKLKEILDNMDVNDVSSLQKAGKSCRDLIQNAILPDDLKKEIIDNFYELKKE